MKKYTCLIVAIFIVFLFSFSFKSVISRGQEESVAVKNVPAIERTQINYQSTDPFRCWQASENKFVHARLIPTEDRQGYICNRCDEFVTKRYGFTYSEIYLLAQLTCGDSSIDGDGEYDIDYQDEVNYHEFSKVLCVVMNRQRHKDYPSSVRDIVLAEGQFIVFPKNLETRPSQKALKTVTEWCDAYDRYDGGVRTIPDDHIFFTGDGIINTTRSEF